MDQQADERVTVFADYVCPFCYLGYASLETYLEEREEPLAVDWHPFDLRANRRGADGRIDPDAETAKGEEYFEEARKNVERLAERYDVEMSQSLATDIDSYDAQRVALRLADEHPDQFVAFHRGVLDALWEEGRDIGTQSVLEELAEKAGLSAAFVAKTLDDSDSADRIEEAFAAAQARQITGVPTFVSGEHSARGAVPPEQLRRLVDGV